MRGPINIQHHVQFRPALSGIIVITIAEVNPISHRRSVEIVSRVNALMRSAHLHKKMVSYVMYLILLISPNT